VVHLRRDRQGRRKVAEIAVIQRHETGLVTAVPALIFTGEQPVVGPGADQLDRLLANR
jgi:hypothetical protein